MGMMRRPYLSNLVMFSRTNMKKNSSALPTLAMSGKPAVNLYQLPIHGCTEQMFSPQFHRMEAEWHWQNELGLSRAASTVRCRDSQHILGAIYTLAVVQLCNRDNFADAMEVITDSTPTFQQQNWHWQIMLGDRQKFSMLSNTVNRGVFHLHQCARQCTRILQMWSEWSLLLSAYNACNWTLDSEQCIVLTLKTHIEVAVTCNAT